MPWPMTITVEDNSKAVETFWFKKDNEIDMLVAMITCDTFIPLMSAPAEKMVVENMVDPVRHFINGHTGTKALLNVDD